MQALVIDGPAKLSGTVAVSGSKNTALPLLFCSLLFDKPVRFENVPRLWDIETTLQLLQSMGASSDWEKDAGTITITPKVTNRVAGYDWVKKMRAGILALGPLVAKFGEARVSLPGGCAIGARPVNYHIDALKQMGCEIEVIEGYIHAKAPGAGLRGAVIEFPQVSVTGTENVLVAAALAKGETVVCNAAIEPEVIALGEMLAMCGSKIEGLGTSTIRVQGRSSLDHPAHAIRIPFDRIEAGTWISIAVATRSELNIDGVPISHLGSVMDAFTRMGVELEYDGNAQVGRVKVRTPQRLNAVDVITEPYPGFPTDMQAQVMVAMCGADGTSSIRETIFENRFMHVAELRRMGARIETRGNTAIIQGPCALKSAPIMATDLRASASLVIAALSAEGQTKISRIYHLDRGYQRLDEKLIAAGARVSRVEE